MNTNTLFKFSLLMMAIPLLAFGQARTVKVLAIEATGKINGKDKNKIALCKKFNPTMQQTKNFFNRADYIPEGLMPTENDHHCYATGALVYSDGSKAVWTLYANGFASLRFMRGDEVSLRHDGNAWCDPLTNRNCSRK